MPLARPTLALVATATVLSLSGSLNAAGILAFGAERGDPPRVVVRINPGTSEFFPEIVSAQFFAFDEGFQGGVRVAVGDFDADATLELVTASGPGMQGTVKIWNLLANGELDPADPLQESFSNVFAGVTGGLYVAAGDFDNSGKDSLVVSAGAGQCRVWIFDDFETLNPNDDKLGNSNIDTFLAFPGKFKNGCRIAMGITNPDTREDLVAANGNGNNTHQIRIYRDTDNDSMLSDETLLDSFVPTINGPYKGMHIAVGNVSEGTTNGEIIVYVTGGGNTTVRVYSDTDNDGIFSEHEPSETFTAVAGGVKSKGGLRLAVSNLDGDARPELCITTKSGDRPDLRLLEAAAGATADVGAATQTLVPYIDSLISTYFKKVPYVAWSD